MNLLGERVGRRPTVGAWAGLGNPAFRWMAVLFAITWLQPAPIHAADCDGDADRICAAESAWYGMGESRVRTLVGDADLTATITMLSGKDVRVRYRQAADGKVNEGELLLIGGRVLALKGGDVHAGHEIDLIDGPALMLQTVVSLLHVAVPSGPSAVKGEQRISLREAKRRIAVATQSASADYGPPWSVSGKLLRTSGNAIDFDLAFEYRPMDPFGGATDEKPQAMELSGTLSYPETRVDLPDSFELKDWKLVELGPQASKQGDSTILDFSAGPQLPGYRTVGDVRIANAKEADPGKPDPTVDLSGFWKEDCKTDFGLEVMPTQDGMYSVSFCGPGGCFEPDTYRPNTYINKDKSYQVISPTEMKILGHDGWSTYLRCADKSPVREK